MRRASIIVIAITLASSWTLGQRKPDAAAREAADPQKKPDAPAVPVEDSAPEKPVPEEPSPPPQPAQPAQPTTPSEPAAVDPSEFMRDVEADLLALWIDKERADWVKATYITHDTELLAAQANERLMAFISTTVPRAAQLDLAGADDQLRRKFHLLKLSQSLAAPADAGRRSELARLATELSSMYGKGRYCPEEGECKTLGELSKTLASSRDYAALHDTWVGWRTISVPMRDKYARFVELANAGAVELGFADTGELWNSRYDMAPAEFEAELERVWSQVKPLYEQLHCYTRRKLYERYAFDGMSADGPIPAHLLGNMWSQDWTNLFGDLAPESGTAFDLTQLLQDKGLDAVGVVKQAEAFFVSLGLDPLPETFWERSMFVRPQDREVVCHASAWDIDWRDDLRIKMCIEITAEDFTTVHHELGHNYYQRAYKDLDPLFTNSANDGFHEALGDVIALSVTPAYLVKIGYLDAEPPDSLNPLMYRALEKIAFLPFSLVVDKWRFDVFSGRVKPAEYNAHWWKLRTEYQGIAPPVARSEADFDPGAKYHVPANVPYTRYFLAHILQFQFHKALCEVAGHDGPLHACSIYDSKEAGARLNAMMEMGLSRPWPDALEALTGQREMDAQAVVDYFAPLMAWLEEQNAGQACGW